MKDWLNWKNLFLPTRFCPSGQFGKPTHIAHICKSHKLPADQNLQKSAILPAHGEKQLKLIERKIYVDKVFYQQWRKYTAQKIWRSFHIQPKHSAFWRFSWIFQSIRVFQNQTIFRQSSSNQNIGWNQRWQVTCRSTKIRTIIFFHHWLQVFA